MPAAPILEIRHLSKGFPGVRALAGVDFFLRRGEIHALMGENGAGKSTLIKVLTGVYPRDGGEILFEGRPFAAGSPHEAQEQGISTVYQEVNLVPNLSVAENLLLGRQPTRGGLIDGREMRRRSEAILERLNLHVDVNQLLGDYSIAVQQMVAIGRALEFESKILILDEPTSSLDAGEVEQLFKVMRKLKAEGHAILFVTHVVDQVYAVSDRITVLRNGELVGEFETSRLPKVELISKLLGKALHDLESVATAKGEAASERAGEPVLRVQGLGKAGVLERFDLEVHAGEVLGLAGLLGSGRTELANLIFGIEKPDQGEVEVQGEKVRLNSPLRALQSGIGLCPEDRKSEGIIEDLSLRENIVLALQVKQGWFRNIPRARQEEIAERYIKLLDIRTPTAAQAIKNLSGGNQQKAIVARWLATQPSLLILDEPTRGIDVGAKAEIQKLILSPGMPLRIATGGIDISVGAVVAIAGAIAGILVARYHAPLLPVLVLPLIAATLCGAFNGLLITGFGIQPIIATLILMVMGRGLGQLIIGGRVLWFRMVSFEYLGTGYLLGLPVRIFVAAALLALLALALRTTPLGLFIQATGGSAKASRYSGLSVGLVKFVVYTFSGLCAGVAGLVLTANIHGSDAALVGMYIELDAILAVVIGGTSMNGGKFNLLGSP